MTTAAAVTLIVPSVVAADILHHARRELPNEACGLLSGDAASGSVRAFHAARNELASPFRFSVDPRDLVRITYQIEATGEDLVAIFHSHPRTAAEPSASDIREARYPDALHLLSGANGELRAWRIAAVGATEVPLCVTPEPAG